MAHHLAYLLCATPRSGTTLLCDLLSATGQSGTPQSYYRRQDLESRAEAWGLRPTDFGPGPGFDEAYLQAVLREGAGETGIFGLRVMWSAVGEISERLASIHPGLTAGAVFEKAFGPIVYIHVTRRDKVGQAVSLLKAEQSGLWHRGADGSDRQRTAAATPLHYDAPRIAELLAGIESDDAAWADFFNAQGVTPVRVEYERLATSPHAELRKILAALGRSPALADGLAPQTSRMADAQSDAWASRFRRERTASAKPHP